jgi:hypothetical protein
MHMAGLPVPAGLDGRVIEELADDDSRRPVRFDAAALDVNSGATPVTGSEEKLIEEKLRDLGYL